MRSRKGFFATSASWNEPPPPPGIIDTLLSPFAAVDVPLRLTPLFTHDAVRGSSLRCLIHVDARDLTFVEDGDSRKVVLEAVAMSFGASSRLIERAGGTYTVRLAAAAAEAARRGGFVVTLALPVKEAGGHQVRAAVRDVTSGRAGSASQFLDVPELRKGRLGLSGIVMSGADASPAPQAASGSAAVYRDGRRIQTLPAPPVMSSSSGEGPIAIAGAFRLGAAMPPGPYTLEVLVADTLRGRKNAAAAVQWIDFEVAE